MSNFHLQLLYNQW